MYFVRYSIVDIRTFLEHSCRWRDSVRGSQPLIDQPPSRALLAIHLAARFQTAMKVVKAPSRGCSLAPHINPKHRRYLENGIAPPTLA